MDYDVKHYAYIGDAVFELFIREIVIQKTKNQALMHKLATKYVRASYQASLIEKIMDELKEDELKIQHQGRNLKITVNKRSNPAMHSLATSFEAVIGYLYLNDKNRLNEIFDIIKKEIN